jgi:hypothetical protein
MMRAAISANDVIRFPAGEPVEFQRILSAVPSLPVRRLTALLVATAAALTAARSVSSQPPPPPLQSKPEKLAFTRTEAAQALRMSVRTLDGVTKRGLLRPSRATGRPLYSRSELESYLKETQSAGLSAQPRRLVLGEE